MGTWLTTNPSTGEQIRSWTHDDESRITQVRDALSQGRLRIRSLSAEAKKRMLIGAAVALLEKKNALAESMAIEMGKPVRDGILEVEKCSAALRFYSENLESFLESQEVGSSSGYRVRVTKEPLGVIMGIMPWNYPLWQVIRFLAPALVAGNVMLLKASELVPATSDLLVQIFHSAVGPGFLEILRLDIPSVHKLIGEDWISGVTFTGSSTVGARIAASAGLALKKTVMELGGADPYLIDESADLDWAAQECAKSRLVNNGQSCIAAKRFLVHEKVYQEFLDLFEKQLQSYPHGDPLRPETTRGPLSHSQFLVRAHQQVESLVQSGNRWRGAPRKKGEFSQAFYEPGLVEMNDDPHLWQTEIFAPVACVWKVSSMNEAIEIANRSALGLGAAIFSRDLKRASFLSEQLECGMVSLNAMLVSMVEAPFGGQKKSGYGRELGVWGMNEFVNFKSLIVKK